MCFYLAFTVTSALIVVHYDSPTANSKTHRAGAASRHDELHQKQFDSGTFHLCKSQGSSGHTSRS